MWDHSFWLMAGWHLHMLFGLAIFLGVVLFIVWAARLKTKVLAKLVVALLVVGILGALLTCGLGWKGAKGMWGELKEGKSAEVTDEVAE